MEFMPPEMSLLSGLLLVVVAFAGSAITAGLGIGGGLTVIAVLASVAPPAAVIPIHGVIQLGSNVGRVAVQRAHIDRPMVAYFIIGSLVGGVIGGSLVVQLPENVLMAALGLFLLYATWGPMRFGMAKIGPIMLAVSGAVSTFVTMFIGATGPFVISTLAPSLHDRRALIGTHAACMTVQHTLKILVFGLLGFSFAPWIPLLVAMIVAGFVGTLLGTRLLHWAPEAIFRKALKVFLTVLAVNLLLSAAGVYT
ncbi:MAG: sulfite exporter TauE/SafE family protein [Alphaproteobacteria bacterium]|nr:sulfite exporter TauE/SafE family protein [Alphaproteobacteria bacterium]